MHNRRWMLMPSFALAGVLYWAAYTVSPNIMLLAANAALPDIEEMTFRVNYRDVVPPTPKPPAESPDELEAAPESIRELLDQSLGEIEIEPLVTEPIEVPDAHERLASEDLTREHDLMFPSSTFDAIESEVVQIAENSARGEIEIARRLVQPNDTRLMGPGEAPAFSSSLLTEPKPLPLPMEVEPALPTDAEPAANDLLEALEPEVPPVEAVALAHDSLPAPSLPAMEVEERLLQQAIRREVRSEDAFESMDRLVQLDTAVYVDPATNDGYFRLRFIPEESPDVPSLRKEVTFVIDASRSIAQRKLNETVQGIRESLVLLRPNDVFNVIVFRDHPRYFKDAPVEANREHLRAAAQFIEDLEAVGATDVYNAVRPILAKPPTSGVPAIVFVASDGRPTGDNLSGRDLINALTAQNTHRVPIYTFGGGNTVNRYLLDLLAYRNKGAAHIVENIDDIQRALPRFFGRFSDAILVDLHADFGRVPRDQVFPREIPDFYRGQVVTLYGRFQPDSHGRFVVRLEGSTGDARKEIILTATLDEAPRGDQQIAYEWAFQKSYHIIGEITRVGETPELIGQLRELNQVYGVPTAYFE